MKDKKNEGPIESEKENIFDQRVIAAGDKKSPQS